jgi:predicted nucleic acid-binding protein
LKAKRRYLTTDYVVGELIDSLYGAVPEAEAREFIGGLLAKADAGVLQLEHVSPVRFQRAWQLRQKYGDKPDISFVDFTSIAVMQELGVSDVFTGDVHFRQVNLGFRLVP